MEMKVKPPASTITKAKDVVQIMYPPSIRIIIIHIREMTAVARKNDRICHHVTVISAATLSITLLFEIIAPIRLNSYYSINN